MNDFIIMTDSCCDLPAQIADTLELSVLPLSFTINGKEHFNYLDNRDISSEYFFIAYFVKEHNVLLLLQMQLHFFLLWNQFWSRVKIFLCICFSSALSTTCASATNGCKRIGSQIS